MDSKVTFIFDGECPFCNKFAELLELKSGLPNLLILNGRENHSLLKKLFNQGYDLDKGAILIKESKVLHGDKAINWICSQITDPSDQLLKVLADLFSSSHRTTAIFPFLIFARRFLLLLKGVPNKLV